MKKYVWEARHVTKLLGISTSKLFHWVQTQGLVEPYVRATRGYSHKFDVDNLIVLVKIKTMYDLGFTLDKVREVLK